MSAVPHAGPAAEPYRPRHHVRIVTAASLFDGHDAAINIMRRILQASGAEVIHLGHNRSVQEIVDCAIQEDAQGIAITSYQGGHLEYFKYMHDLVREAGVDIRIFGGGGGTILPDEIDELQAYGIARIFSPDDGRALGLQGMINEVLRQCDFATGERAGEGAPGGAAPARSPQPGPPDQPGREPARGRRGPHGAGGGRGRGRAGDPGAGHHRHRRRGQVLPGGRARAALPAGLRRPDRGHRLGGPVAAAQRRRPAGRPHPHERHRRSAGLHALAGHPPVQPGPLEVRAPGHRHLQGGRLRPGDRRDQRHRPERHRDHRALGRLALRDDRRVRRRDPAREDRHAGLRRPHRHQQVRPAGLAGRAARRAQAVPAQPQPVRDGGRGPAGLRHHRLPVQRPGHEPAVPGADGRRRRPHRRGPGLDLHRDRGHDPAQLRDPARARPLPGRDRRPQPPLRRVRGRPGGPGPAAVPAARRDRGAAGRGRGRGPRRRRPAGAGAGR